MNPVHLLVWAGYAAIAAWFVVRGDWLVKTWRSTALVVASVAALPVLGFFLQPPVLFIAWFASVVVLWMPLIFRFSWVMSLGPPDGPLAKDVDRLQVAAARASRDFKAGRIDGASLALRIETIRDEAAKLTAPDAEWGLFLHSWIADLEISERMARNPGDPNLAIDDAQVVRAETHTQFAELVSTRASFWR